MLEFHHLRLPWASWRTMFLAGPFFGFGALTTDSGTFRFRAKQAMLIKFETKEAR